MHLGLKIYLIISQVYNTNIISTPSDLMQGDITLQAPPCEYMSIVSQFLTSWLCYYIYIYKLASPINSTRKGKKYYIWFLS